MESNLEIYEKLLHEANFEIIASRSYKNNFLSSDFKLSDNLILCLEIDIDASRSLYWLDHVGYYGRYDRSDKLSLESFLEYLPEEQSTIFLFNLDLFK